MASAVVVPVPKQDGPKVKSPRMKRRQSSLSEEAFKRPRISTEDSAISPSTLHSSSHVIDSSRHESSERTQPLANLPEQSRNNPERRRSSIQEERKRGQRLFGGLLNTLNQSTPDGQQKKRQEVEARQKERATQRKAEAEDRKKEKMSNLKVMRAVEQVKFQKESVSYDRGGEGNKTDGFCKDANSAYEHASYGPISIHGNRAKTRKDYINPFQGQLLIYGSITSHGYYHPETRLQSKPRSKKWRC